MGEDEMRPGKTLVDNGLGCYLVKGKEGKSKAVGREENLKRVAGPA